MKTTLVIERVTPSLNHTLKEHRAVKKKRREMYQYEIRRNPRNRHTGRVHMVITRFCHCPLDYDNFVGGAKVLIDALKLESVIIDDRLAVIGRPDYNQVQIPMSENESTVIQIEDAGPVEKQPETFTVDVTFQKDQRIPFTTQPYYLVTSLLSESYYTEHRGYIRMNEKTRLKTVITVG